MAAEQISLSRRKIRARTPLAVVVLIVSFLCPTEFSLFIADLRIPPHRLALLVLLPIALYKLLTAPDIGLRGFDLTIIAFNVWTAAIFMYHLGSGPGLAYGGALALESLGAYLVARAWIRDGETFLAVIKTLATAVLVAALFALPETLLGQHFTHDALKALTGYDHPTTIETRLHLTRAYGTFDHPIHYGTFCASLLALFWYASTSRTDRYRRAVLLGVATFLGLSSAPILCLAFQIALLLWERITRGIPSRTTLTLTAIAGLYIGASLVMTRSPINFIATELTLDHWTGFYRLLIWQYGLENVWAFPWTGIGLQDWARPDWMANPTVDAFWLVVMMREGIPAIVLLAASIALVMRAVAKRGLRHPDPHVCRIARGWIMSLVALCLIGTTVHYWNVLYSYFFFFIGLAGWMADSRRQSAKSMARRAGAMSRRPDVAMPPPLPARKPSQPKPGGFGPLPSPA